MSRGKGLERGSKPLKRTPMAPSAPSLARTPMARNPPKSPPKPPRKTGASADVRAQAIDRDRATCQRCGRPGSNLQHREGRGSGGRGKADAARTNAVEWLVVLCGSGNTSGCHQAVDNDREAAERDGFVIRRNGPEVDASTVPVRTYQGWRLFTKAGKAEPCDTPEHAA